MNDAYKRELVTKVKNIEGNSVILEDTIFYPNSGGQPNDIGKIICGEDEYIVLNVAKINFDVSHEIDKPGLKIGDEVRCVIDWDRRYKLMRSHTACHVMSAVLFNEIGAKISGNQLSLEKCRVDFNLEDYDSTKMKEYTDKANKIILQANNINISYITREEAEKNPDLAKLASGLIQGIDELRVIEIENVDVQCDGGTHVKNTSEVGQITFLKSENKGKNNRRVYFELN